MLKKSLLTFITRAINSLGSVLLSIVLAVFWGSDGIGTYMIAVAALLGFNLLARYGADLYLLKNCSIHYIDKDFSSFKSKVFSSFKFVLCSSALLFIFLLAISFYLIYSEENVRLGILLSIFSFIIPLLSFLTQVSTLLKCILKPQLAPFFEFNFASFLLSIIISIFLYFNITVSLNTIAVIHLILILILFVVGVMTLYIADKRIFKAEVIKKCPALKLNKELTDMFVPSFMHYIIQWGTLIIISFLATESEVGVYSAAHRVSFLVNFILIVLNSVTAPHFASYYKAGKIEELEALAVKSTKFMMILGFPTFLFLFFFATEIFSFIGEDFNKSGEILAILIFGQLINLSTGSVAFLLNMTGQQRHMRNIMLVSASITVISCIVLTNMFGIIGAAISTAIGLILQNLLASWKVNKILNIKSIPGWKWISELKLRKIK